MSTISYTLCVFFLHARFQNSCKKWQKIFNQNTFSKKNSDPLPNIYFESFIKKAKKAHGVYMFCHIDKKGTKTYFKKSTKKAH